MGPPSIDKELRGAKNSGAEISRESLAAYFMRPEAKAGLLMLTDGGDHKADFAHKDAMQHVSSAKFVGGYRNSRIDHAFRMCGFSIGFCGRCSMAKCCCKGWVKAAADENMGNADL